MRISFAKYMSPKAAPFLLLVNELLNDISTTYEEVDLDLDSTIDEVIIGLIIQDDQALAFFKKSRPAVRNDSARRKKVNNGEPVKDYWYLTFECTVPYQEFLEIDRKRALIKTSLIQCIKKLILPKRIADFDLTSLIDAINRVAD